jgi:hypothetical protein
MKTEPLTILPISVEIRTAQSMISACEACAQCAEIPFDWLLAAVRGWNDDQTDYFMTAPAYCPQCHAEVSEKTLVEPDGGWEVSSDTMQPLLTVT